MGFAVYEALHMSAVEAVFFEVLNRSIAASWFIAAVILLRLVFRRAPRWAFCLLWGLVGLRLVCPFSLESVLSLIPSAQTVPPAIVLDRTPEIASGVSSVDGVVNAFLQENLAPVDMSSVNPLQIWSFVLALLWAAGAVFMVIYAMASYLLLMWRMRTATLLRDNIRQTEMACSPFVLGVVRPVIYLPYDLEEGDIAHVVAHERAHIHRRDHWWKPLGFLVLAVHWFNPLVWLAYVLLCRDIEAACDARVAAAMDDTGRRAYAAALLNCSMRRPTGAACPLAFGEVGVKVRVKGVMSWKKPALWVTACAAVMCVLLGVCFLTDPAGGAEPAGGGGDQISAEEGESPSPSPGVPGTGEQTGASGEGEVTGTAGTESVGNVSFDPAQYGITEAELKCLNGLPDFSSYTTPMLVSYFLHTDGAGTEGAQYHLYERLSGEGGDLMQYLSVMGPFDRAGEWVGWDGACVGREVCRALAYESYFRREGLTVMAESWHDPEVLRCLMEELDAVRQQYE